MSENLLEARDLIKEFRLPGGWLTREVKTLRAVDGVSLTIRRGEVYGLVGESGCGKTTLGRILLRLVEPTSGQILFDGRDFTHLTQAELRRSRRQMQIVFQNPLSSLSPRMKIADIVSEPLRAASRHVVDEAVRQRVVETLERVGLGAQHLERFPHELSGGQCQRVAIARALMLRPGLLILDEPTSALDVSVQAQIINLLEELRRSYFLTYLFISHDLNLVQHLSDRIGVMYLGQMVEEGPSEAVFDSPLHPYTRALLSSIPLPEVGIKRERIILQGTVPSPLDPPSGCRFHTRCPIAQDRCRHESPELRPVAKERTVACHFA